MSESKMLKVEYYALLRDESGLSRETINSFAATPQDLYFELAKRHQFSLGVENLKVAVNDQFANWNTTLQSNDVIVFIPPVAGG